MTKGLEGIVDISVSGSDVRVNLKSYNSGAFADAVVYAQEVSGADISTIDGLEQYGKLIGRNLKDMPATRVGNFKQKADGIIGSQIQAYASKNFSGIVGDLTSEDQLSLALKYVPKNPLIKPKDGDEPDSYEIAREGARSGLKVLDEINNDPQKVLEDAVKGGGVFALYVASDQREYLQIEQSIAQERAIIPIRSYGAKKFLIKTQKGLTRQAKNRDRAIEQIAKANEKASSNVNHVLTAEEQAILSEAGNKKLTGYSDVGLLSEMYQGVIGPVVNNVLIKRAEEAKKAVASSQAA